MNFVVEVNLVLSLLKLMDQTIFLSADQCSCQKVSRLWRQEAFYSMSLSEYLNEDFSFFWKPPGTLAKLMIRVARSGSCHKKADGRKKIFVNDAQFQQVMCAEFEC